MARKFFASGTGLILVSALSLWMGSATAQSKEKTIYAFDLTHGVQPVSGLVADSAGNLYGTAYNGGLYPVRRNPCCGTVFELSRGANGAWSQTVLYAFQGLADGSNPFGTMVFDKQGNLYGTDTTGGFEPSSNIFEISKGSNGTWSAKTIYSIPISQGAFNGDLTLDSEGNIYVTTQDTSSPGGEVFELSLQSEGRWKETVLYAFSSTFPLGDPIAGVSFDRSGNLYGTTYGSKVGNGGVYELSRQSNGQWKPSVLFTFTGGNGGCFPNNKLILDSSGNLYGTTLGGGNNSTGCEVFTDVVGCGIVFELSPAGTETVLHVFTGGEDGGVPLGGVVLDSAGNLYGTAESDRTTRNCSHGTSGCGTANRTHRNMLVYLAGDHDRIEELERSVREYLGWSEILAKEDDLNLTTSQRNQATERRAKASETDEACGRISTCLRPRRFASSGPRRVSRPKSSDAPTTRAAKAASVRRPSPRSTASNSSLVRSAP